MAKKKEREELKRQGYVSTFTLTGTALVNENTFSLDQMSNKSNWIYNRMNLGVSCGDQNGTVYASAMGGYGADRENVIYVHGRMPDGSDDFTNRYTVNFDDRNDPNVIKEVGQQCYFVAGLEKDNKDKTVYRNFLSAYDFIQYVNDHLENGTPITVRGNIEYRFYNGGVVTQCNITNLALSNMEPKDYKARFVQTMLIDSDCFGKPDKETGEADVVGYALEYAKEYNGHDITDKDGRGTMVPMPYTYKYKVNMENPDLAKKAIKKLFGVKKGSVNQITMEGDFVSGGAVVTLTADDLPDDVKELVALGIMSQSEAIAACATNGNRERKMVLTRPRIRNVQDKDGVSTPEVQIMEDVYSEEDLDYFRSMTPPEFEAVDEDLPFEDKKDEPEEVDFESVTDDDSMDWLSNL